MAQPEMAFAIVPQTLASLEAVIERGLTTFVEVGNALMEIRDGRLYYDVGYSRFEDYCRERWGWSRVHAHRLIESAEVAAVLPMGNTPTTERQARELARLKEPQAIRETWVEITEQNPQPTAREIREAVEMRQNPDRLTAAQAIVQSNENEWYTPVEYIAAARQVLGQIDLDPSSSPLANETVQARFFFTQDDDGLRQPWLGRIWLNPPYGRLAALFIERLVAEYRNGHVNAAITLVNAHSTDTAWFQPLWDFPLCFTDHRIDFDSNGREKKTTSTHGSVFAYLGSDDRKFSEVFAEFGAVVRRWP